LNPPKLAAFTFQMTHIPNNIEVLAKSDAGRPFNDLTTVSIVLILAALRNIFAWSKSSIFYKTTTTTKDLQV